MRLDRRIQKQIEEATRDKLSQVEVKDNARLVSYGKKDFSSEPSAPTIMWHLEFFRYHLGRGATPDEILFHLNRKSQVYRNYGTIAGTLGGGFNADISSDGFGRLGMTHIYTTRIMSRSDRAISSFYKVSGTQLISAGDPLFSNPCIAVFVKSELSTGKYPDWTQIVISNAGGSSLYTQPFSIDLQANDWIQVSLFVYAGYSWNLAVREAFKDINIQFDSWRLNDIDPPDPPAIVDLQSNYIDRSAGTTKNMLTIATPDEDDWLGVGIYRTTPLSRTTGVRAGPSGSEMLSTASLSRTDFNRAYTWNIYGSENQDYYFIRENQYLNNLIPNGTLDYSSAHWRHGTYSSNIIKLVREAPYSPPFCLKSSAAYNAGATGDMYIQSSTMAVNKLSNYSLIWFTKTEYWTHTSGRNSAVQINYYTNATRTPCASTAYQIIPWSYNQGNRWVDNNLIIYSNSAYSRLNPGLSSGSSALSHFIMPRDCKYIDIKFKMLHNSSCKSIIYFDGANAELDSGQPSVYHSLQAQGTNLFSRESLTFVESTAFGRTRIPFRGATTELYYGHTTVASGDSVYLSSAYWSKFAKGLNFTGTYVNEIKNGSFQRWTSPHQPTDWSSFGTDRASCWPASTAVFGSTSIGIYWHSAAGSGWAQTWNGSVDRRAWYTFWAKLDTGQARIGDTGQTAILYKHSAYVSISAQTNGKEWNKYAIYLSTAQDFHIRSDTKGTRLYVDGIQVETARGYKNAWYHEYDPIRIIGGSTARSATYVKSSSNSFTPSNYTVRFWYSPTSRWNTNSAQPRNVLWSCGQDATGSRNITTHRIYYVPYTNSDSAGGYFEYYLEDNTPKTTRIRSPRITFDYNEPIHIVATYSSQFGNVSVGQHTKLYINGVPSNSASPNGLFQYPANPVKADNLFIGALKGGETSTAFSMAQDLGTFRFGHANGVISEFRNDNYAWSHEEVVIDRGGNVPRPVRSATLTSVEYKHIADRIRDGSEKESFTYEDFDVEAGSTYDYVLDAFDYSGNRSLFSDSASITAGDTIAPGPVTNTGAAINKSNHVTFYWTNPTDEDFSHCRVYHQHPPYTNFDRVFGVPGARSTWSMGFIGYGATANIFVRPIDHLGNESAASEVRITARTKKGPIKVIDGSIFTNAGYGLETGLTPLFRKDALSWGKVYYTTTNPNTPKYSDLQVRHFTDDSANAGIVISPVQMSSVTGLLLNTAYHLYLIDSASGRTNALRMRWSLSANVAESITAYPLGRFYTGNATVKGYFNPNQDVSQFTQGVSLVAPRIESQTGKTYFDLKDSILHSENTLGEWVEVRPAGIYQKIQGVTQAIKHPIIKFIPASSVNAGADNSFSSWGLGTFSEPPQVVILPSNVRTYSTAHQLGLGRDTAQSLSMGVTVLRATCAPYVKIIGSGSISESHLTFARAELHTTGGSAPIPSVNIPKNIFNTWGFRHGVATVCAWDTATGNQSGFSGLGGANSTAISRIDMEVEFYSSATTAPRYGRHYNIKFYGLYCSAASNKYEDHEGGSDTTTMIRHKATEFQILFTVPAGQARTLNSFTFSKAFTVTDPWKPMLKLIYCSAEVQAWGAQAASEVIWADGSYVPTSGGRWMNNLKLRRITYYSDSGPVQAQTGYGIVSALVIGS